ncbi:hypothetical protein POPTR_016G012601v4 [Populus trichocarpa]|uniref:Uncharacterized protein n=1 Tax=Populus trichocarpa TaxID=3694 RepID=A0ACC0RSS7_POPTR|nr:hypothetical protein POPTR_016G012601v4 [Populus trichocarpa]
MIAEILCRLQAQKLPCFRSHSLDTSSNLYIIIRTTSHVHYMGFDQNLVSSGCFTLKELNHPLMCYNHGIKVLGSVNGLLCVSNVVDDIAVWNPTIRKYFGTKSCSVYVIGFGYDCVSDDYKRSFESEVKVYSLKKQSWGRIGDMPYFISHMECIYTRNIYYLQGWFIDLLLHSRLFFDLDSQKATICTTSHAFQWSLTQGDESNIAAFDIQREEFCARPLPGLGGSADSYRNLGVLGHCLCLVSMLVHTYSKDCDHEFLLKVHTYSRKFIWYDLKTRTYEDAGIPCYQRLFDAYTFVGSLKIKKRNKVKRKRRSCLDFLLDDKQGIVVLVMFLFSLVL